MLEYYLLSIILTQTIYFFIFLPVVNSEPCDSDLTVGDLPIKDLKSCGLGIINVVAWMSKRECTNKKDQFHKQKYLKYDNLSV